MVDRSFSPTNPWVMYVPGAFAAGLDTEEKRYWGVDYSELWNRVVEPLDAEEIAQFRRALEWAEREGLWRHSHNDWEHVLLTPKGWKLLPGGMPGRERDEPFVRELVRAWNDPEVRRWRGRILGSTVYGRLGWPFNQFEVLNIARRLQEEGLVAALEMDGDAAFRPSARALEAPDSVHSSR